MKTSWPANQRNTAKQKHLVGNTTLLKVKKQRLAKKILDEKNISLNTRCQYNRVCNPERWQRRNLKKQDENDLYGKGKENSKAIWYYSKPKSKTKAEIGDLYTYPNNPNSKTANKDDQKANILANYFSGVFSIGDDTEIPHLPRKEVRHPLQSTGPVG